MLAKDMLLEIFGQYSSRYDSLDYGMKYTEGIVPYPLAPKETEDLYQQFTHGNY